MLEERMPPRKILTIGIFMLAMSLCAIPARAGDVKPAVRTMRLPAGGVQPQAVVDDRGGVHIVYLAGDPAHADVYYIHTTDGGLTFSSPLRVNSQPGSAVALGTVRGAQLAMGRGGRLHVAWNGSRSALPKSPGGAPMLYSRSNDDGTAFEPQRNVNTVASGALDGGGTIAADDQGNVFVFWHASPKKEGGETARRVWMARSTDDGRTFAPETIAFNQLTGACSCCAMQSFADHHGDLYVMYRSCTEQVHRDFYLLSSQDASKTFTGSDISPMKINECILSTAAMTQGSRGVLGAWETSGQVWWGTIDPKTRKMSTPIAAPGQSHDRKHPTIAANADGQVLLAWVERTGWNRGGSLAWQVFDKTGQPIIGASGTAADVPVWGAPAAFATPDGAFVIVY
jgi:hypothetical protein